MKTHIRSIVALVAGLSLVAGCGGGSDDEASSGDGTTIVAAGETTTTVEGNDVVEGEDGETVDLDALDTRVEDAEPYDEILELTIDDLQSFWSVVLPETYDLEYTPIDPDAIFPYDATTDPPGCPDALTYEDMAGNAFYCSIGDFVAWDQGTLFPQLYEEFGPFSLAMVLAHEWGHAIQDQTGTEGPTVMLEQQADCFAGAWTGYLDSGGSETLSLDPGDLELALGGMLKFRDEPGTAVEDPSAHGSGFDRIAAFQEGYRDGPARCADYPNDPPILAPLQFTDEAEFESSGNLPLDEAIEVAVLDLNDYWAVLLEEGFVPVDAVVPYTMDEGPPTCGGTEIDPAFAEFNLYFCIDENYVAWDDELLAVTHAEIGDFGVAALLSSQWATSVQVQSGYTEETTATALQRDCFAGSWAGNLYNYTVGGPEVAGREAYLTLSPGDLDEAIQAFISFSVAAGSEEAELYGTAFDRTGAFREGFLDGAAVCIAYTEG